MLLFVLLFGCVCVSGVLLCLFVVCGGCCFVGSFGFGVGFGFHVGLVRMCVDLMYACVA